jgi:hypothetical protein
MRYMVVIVAALLLGAACDSGDTSHPPTPDAGATLDVTPADAPPNQDAGPDNKQGGVMGPPDPRLKDGAWCPTEECLLRFRHGAWDCDPGLSGGSAAYMAAMCWPPGQ